MLFNYFRKASNFLYFRKGEQTYMPSSLVEASPLMLTMWLSHILKVKYYFKANTFEIILKPKIIALEIVD